MSELMMKMGSAEGVPPGAYTGEFAGIEPMPAREDMPEGIRWKWSILGSDHAGRVVGRITGKKPTKTNACGKILNGLAGRVLGEGEQINLGTYIGNRYTLVVSAGSNGGTRVDAVVPAK